MDDTPIRWQAEADSLAAYLDSRALGLPDSVTLLTWALAATARALSESDEQTAAAVARLTENMERLAGLPAATRQ